MNRFKCPACGSQVICSYCGKTIDKPKKVGPRLRYCGTRCYVQDAYEKHPGTSLAKMVKRMYPEIVRG